MSGRPNDSGPIRVPVEGDFLRLYRASGQGYVLLPVQGSSRRRRVHVGHRFHTPDGRNVNPAALEVAGEFLRDAENGLLLPPEKVRRASGRDVARAVRARAGTCISKGVNQLRPAS